MRDHVIVQLAAHACLKRVGFDADTLQAPP
jgi:hypothetical protein